MMNFSAAVARTLTVGLLMALAASATAQQAYPSKPIRFITPYPPGGGTTTMARLIGQKLTDSWGQPVIVDNRPGGNTIIGTEALAKSRPDGYTILLTGTIHVITPLLFPAPYDPIRDFSAVATLTGYEQLLVLHPLVPANNLQEFIAYAKSKPGQLNYATPGAGGASHLTVELFSIMAGVKMQHVPYKGSAPALTDLIGGQVQLSLVAPSGTIPHIKNGRLKAIAVGGETRMPALPEVPTFTEAGLPGFEVKNWYGVLAPAGTAQEIIDKLSGEIGRIVAAPDYKEKVVSQGMDPFISTPRQFAVLLKADMARFGKIIKTANIKADE